MVAKTDYEIGRAEARQKKRMATFAAALGSTASSGMKILLYERYKSARKDVQQIEMRSRIIKTCTFNINNYSEFMSLHDFRFKVTDLPKIADLLHLPNSVTKRRRYRCDSITSCCIVLKRLSSPSNWKDLETTFGMASPMLSEIFWETIEMFTATHGHLVTALKTDLLRERAALYAERIKCKGAPLDRCVGFIDCTKIRMERPGGINGLQRSCYSGHKRMCCLSYQTITTPDGLIFSLYGPEVGRRHDITLLRGSGINEALEACLIIEEEQYYVFGDDAYILRPWFQVSYSRLTATPAQNKFNTEMSSMREAVEWSYKDLKQMWTRNDFARSLKVRQAPISLIYISSTLLLNFKTCIENGGQVGAYFNCSSPTLNAYIAS